MKRIYTPFKDTFRLYDLITKRNLRFIIFEAKGEQAVNV